MDHELDWSHYRDQGMGDAYADIPKEGGDFAKAVAVCIRSGVCEQQSRGVMCPSYRISQDPQMSPGGRVTILKKALNSEDPDALVKDKELAKAMASCVSCKGCKRECENNLDIAQIKAEYLAQKLKVKRGSIRSWLFANFPWLLYRYPWLGALICLRNRTPVLARLMEKIVGITASVSLPEPAKRPFFHKRRVYFPYKPDKIEDTVVLLVDSFTALFRPQVAEDALKLLRSAGYSVWLIQPVQRFEDEIIDSGRTLFSQGRIPQAREAAERLLTKLLPHLNMGRKIIGLEPSALLMLRDEFLTMGLGEDAQRAADSAFLLEEFIARERQNNRFNLSFRSSGDTKYLVHGHCHQKAVGAMKSYRKALRLIPDLNVEFIEASCCGMAGTFGLEAEHIDESLAMAQADLLPAIAAQPKAQLICSGFSCAHQIERLTKRPSLHLATLLAEHLDGN